MQGLSADFTDQDLDLVFDLLDSWERQPQSELSMVQMLQQSPLGKMMEGMPEGMQQSYGEFNNMLSSKEKQIKDTVQVRKERATLLKAKILLLKQTRAIDKLCNESPAETPSAS